MSVNNSVNKLVRLILLAGGAAALAWSLVALWRDPPNFRFLLFLAAAVIVSWPHVRLPIRASEPLFFLAILIFGPAAGIVISTAATAVASRRYYRTRFALFLLRVGVSSFSAAAAGFVVTRTWWVESGTSASLFNLLALLAAVRLAMQTDWSGAIGAIRNGRMRREFSRGKWLNSLLASFGAAFTAGVVLLVSKEQNPQVTLLSAVIVIIFYFAYRHFRNRYITRFLSVKSDAEELSALQIRTLDALSSAIDGKDPQKYRRARRLQLLSEGVARALGLPEHELNSLRAASLLREVGGGDPFTAIATPSSLVPAIRYQQEHWDGTGFPNHLRGQEIPVSARIIAVVDAFETICGNSSGPVSRDQAINLLIAESGRRFDPAIVQTFLNHLPAFQSELAKISRGGRRSGPVAAASSAVTPAEELYLEALRRARKEGSELLDLAQALSSTLNLEEAISIIISRLSRLTTFDTYAIYVCEEGLESIYIAGAIGAYADELRMHQLPPGLGVIGRAVASGERAVDQPLGDEFAEFGDDVRGAFRSITAIPLGKAGRIHGAIVLLSKAENAYRGENQRVVDVVVPLAVDAVVNALAYRRTEASAVTDPLTGLANSRMLPISYEEESNRAERYETKLAMLMIDLDGFKQVNDTFGHLAGDQVLREVAHCLKKELRASDKLIRYGGDEFIALLPHADEKSIDDLIARIQNYLESRCHVINGIEVRLGASIGYSIFGRDGQSLDEMIRVADEGMYRNKSIRKRQIKTRRRKPASKEDPEAALAEAVA